MSCFKLQCMWRGLFSRFKMIQTEVAVTTYIDLWRVVHSAVSSGMGSGRDGFLFLFYSYPSGRDQATA